MGIYLLQGCISWTDYRDDFQFLSLRIIARRTDKSLDRVTNGENVKFKATAVSTYSRFATIVINFICDQISRVNRDVGPRCRIADRIPCHIIDFLYLEYKSREER